MKNNGKKKNIKKDIKKNIMRITIWTILIALVVGMLSTIVYVFR